MGRARRVRRSSMYDQQACETFFDGITQIFKIEPYAGTLESLHVLLFMNGPLPNANGMVWNIGSVQERLNRRLGHLVRVNVSWYVPKEDYESTSLGL